ncbi:MAG: TRAP transporter large permease [Caulobacterales bacterium]
MTVLFATFAVLLVIGTPVGAALLLSSIAAIAALGLPPDVAIQQMASGMSSISLLAIPLFIFAGELMMRGGLSEKIIALAVSLVGRLRGGLGQVTIVSSTLFGGVSGSAIADVSAVGGSMIPQMVQRGYDRDFAVNVTISSALIALLLPPSHNMILYSASAGGGISITDLFLAGIAPALTVAAVLMVTTYLMARRRGYGSEPFPGWRAIAVSFVAATPGLILVGIIFLGIRSGVFTAIESAAVAVIYAAAITALLYRRLRADAFREAVVGALRSTGNIMIVIGAAAAFGWVMGYLQAPAAAVALMESIADNQIMVLLMMVAALLILGTFMDMAPLVIIATPVFLPVAKAFGVDPVHFGVIMILSCGIGLLTPPVGSVLFIGSAIGGISATQAVKGMAPFYLALLAVLALVVVWPGFSLALPHFLR